MKLNHLYAIIIVALCGSVLSVAHAADSDYANVIRLDRNGEAFETAIPVYDQLRHSTRDAGLCYAISASEIIDAYRFRADGGRLATLTSPLQIALAFHASHPKSIYKTTADFEDYDNRMIDKITSAIDMISAGDDEADVFKAFDTQKICDQKFLQHFDAEIANGKIDPTLVNRPSDDDSTENFLRQVLIQARATRAGTAPSPLSFFGKRVARGQLDESTLRSASMAAAAKEAPIEQVVAFVDAICANHTFSVTLPTPHTEALLNNTKAQTDAYGRINKLLELHRPVAITWDPSVATYNFGSQASHESVIIGRRFDAAGNCDFLIRDSYGPTCRAISATRPLLHACENGSEWVSAVTLLKSAGQISWIEE